MAKILSIEVGLSQVRVAEIEQKGKKSRMSSCFRFATPQGAVEDGYIRDTQSLGDLLKHELGQRKIKTKKVSFVVASSRVASREVRLPLVKQNRLQNIVEANATDYFPIDVTKYIMSYGIIDIEEKEDEKQYHLMVYASPKSISAAYQELAVCAGLVMVRLDYIGDSIYNAVKDEFSQGTHILMKIEEKNTLIMVVKDGELSLQRNLNYGMDSAVETVRTYPVFGSNLDFEGAVQVLCTRNCIRRSLDMPAEENEPADTDDFVREARREVTESLRYLVGNISRIMDYYISRNTDAEFESIVCCGLGAELKGLPELLTNELGQRVSVLEELKEIQVPKNCEDGSMAVYAAVTGSMKSTVNLMEKVTKKEKEAADNLRGAFLVFGVGLVSALALAGAGVAMRMYQENEQNRLNQRIEEEKSIEQIYEAYNDAKEQYDNFQVMYQYTNTPNEGLVAFIEEMEEKMPSNITVETFSSTGTQVSFSMRVTSKSEAANTLLQLRTFKSLNRVNTTGIDESEDGTVSMSVTCSYSEPAPLESGLS
ncbi:MAG: pilus assembly protein PilM [Eubacteriales bacterium]|nr:pilus assembly protein PilM [Eubacteriales bacterium]